MKNLLSHFDLTNKSASAFAVAIIGLLTCYKVIGLDAAAAWTVLAMAVLSILIPARPDGNQLKSIDKCTTDALAVTAKSTNPNAPVKREDS